MPLSPKNRCTRCRRAYRGSRCEPCYLAKQRHHNQKPQRQADMKFYKSKEWLMLRASQLKRQPKCHCGNDANFVDHIVPRRVSPGRALDSGNLQSLCHACHSRKTATETRFGAGG